MLTDLGLGLQERASTTPSSEGTWQSVAASTWSGPSGRLQVHLASETELAVVRDSLHDKAFQLGSDMVSLTVTDDAALATQAKTAAGGPDAGRAPRAPQPRPAREFTLHGLNSPPWRLALHRLR